MMIIRNMDSRKRKWTEMENNIDAVFFILLGTSHPTEASG